MIWMLRISTLSLIAQLSDQASFCSIRFAIPAKRRRSPSGGGTPWNHRLASDGAPTREASYSRHLRLSVVSPLATMNETELSTSDGGKKIQRSGIDDGPRSQLQHRRPVFFGTPPPAKEIARLLVKRSGKAKTSDGAMASLTLQPVSAVGRLHSVRLLARSLCVCELIPSTSTDIGTFPWAYSWAFGENQEMTVQLLAVGDMAASVEELSHCIVLVRGTTVVDKKESLKNWVKNSQLDVKVASIQRVNDTIWAPLAFSSDAANDCSQLYQTCSSKPRTEGLRFLRLSDVYPPARNRKPVTLVNSLASIESFALSVAKMSSTVASSVNQTSYVGIDCEWKPDTLSQPEDVQPILLLQIAMHDAKEVYLLDLQSLLRPLMPPNEELNAVEASVSAIVSHIWQSSRFIKVGFQVVGDLRRLAASYPHMKCFETVHSVMEVSRMARKVMRVVTKQRNSKFVTSSLARLVEHSLQRSTDKEQQCSDWSARPLSAAQLEYAALDAAIAPYLLDHSVMPCGNGVQVFREPRLHVGRWIGDASFDDCITSWEFVPATSTSVTPFKGESSRKRDKRHQRLFGNLPPVVTHRREPGPHR